MIPGFLNSTSPALRCIIWTRIVHLREWWRPRQPAMILALTHLPAPNRPLFSKKTAGNAMLLWFCKVHQLPTAMRASVFDALCVFVGLHLASKQYIVRTISNCCVFLSGDRSSL